MGGHRRCAVLGIGRMGLPLAERLLEDGHGVTVWNRTAAKAAALAECGATLAASPEAAIDAADVIVLMLSDGAAIRAVLERRLMAPGLEGKAIVQMGTIAPGESRSLARQVKDAGGVYLEAPVLGSIREIRERTLTIMVGAEPEVHEQYREFLRLFGPSPVYVGPVGRAAALKLALNQLIASLTAAFSMSLGLCLREGVSTELFMGILRESALHAKTFDKKLPLMLARDFGNPNFYTQHLLKDVELFLREASASGVRTEPLEGVKCVIERALAMGLAECDYSSIYNAVNPED